MSTTKVVPSIWYTPLFGFVVGIVTLLFANLFVGYGGKAGTTCFCSVNLTMFLLFLPSLAGLATVNINDYFQLLTEADLTFLIIAIFTAVYGLMVTILLREKVLQKYHKRNEAILGPALVQLATALVLPWILPTALIRNLAAVMASGTYAGMVSRKIVARDIHLIIAGVVVGVLNVLLATVFIGFGGKLGFIGLLGIALLHYLETHLRIEPQIKVVKA